MLRHLFLLELPKPTTPALQYAKPDPDAAMALLQGKQTLGGSTLSPCASRI